VVAIISIGGVTLVCPYPMYPSLRHVLANVTNMHDRWSSHVLHVLQDRSRRVSSNHRRHSTGWRWDLDICEPSSPSLQLRASIGIHRLVYSPPPSLRFLRSQSLTSSPTLRIYQHSTFRTFINSLPIRMHLMDRYRPLYPCHLHSLRQGMPSG